MNKEIADIIHNVFDQHKTLQGQLADLGELVSERDCEERTSGSNTKRMVELNKMIDMQISLVLRRINHWDNEEYQPVPSGKLHLRIVK